MTQESPQISRQNGVFKLLPMSPEAASTKTKTLTMFRKIITTSTDMKGCRYFPVATRLVLDAYDRKMLSWKQLALFLLHGVQFPDLYFEMVFTPTVILADRNPDDTICDPDPQKVRACEEKFVSRLQYIANVLEGNIIPPRLGANEELEGKSLSYWIHGGLFQHSDDHHNVVARAYETELLRDPIFLKEAEQIQHMVNLSSWHVFLNSHNSEFECRGSAGTIEKSKMDAIRHFCAKWCLGNFTVQPKSAKQQYGFSFWAMRFFVRPRSDGTGLDVFIPRFYNLSHIKNYHDKDFDDLKKSLEGIFTPYRKRADRKSVKELLVEAKAMKRQLQQQGISKSDAWEQTRKYMAWSRSTMQSRLGIRPK